VTKKGSFLRFAQDSVCHFLFCHSDPELKRRGRISSFHQIGRVLIRDSSGDLPPRNDRKGSLLRRLFAAPSHKLRASAQDIASWHLAPQNDRMRSRQLFSISNFRSPLHLYKYKLIFYNLVENFERREKKYENEGFFLRIF